MATTPNWSAPAGAQTLNTLGQPDYKSQAAQMYRDQFGRDGDAAGVDYWAGQLSGGMTPEQASQNMQTSANTVYKNYAQDPISYNTANPGMADYFKNDAGQTAATAAKASIKPPSTSSGFFNLGSGASGIPDYMGLAKQQSDYNMDNARLQSQMNNPNFIGPGGSQTRVMNADGTYTVKQTLNPQLQQNYDSYNTLQGSLTNKASQLAGNTLNYSGAPAAPTFDTSGVSAIPTADANNLATMRDSVYSQQTQYLDPQFEQGQSSLENKLANQGIMPGSEAYNKEMSNFALTKQKAYGDARNSAIQAGGQEQSRLFGLGLQSNQAGMNNALAGFNTGLQGRQQGVSEANTLHNSPLNDLASLRSGQAPGLPTYQAQNLTSIPGVNLLDAANYGMNAQLGLQNAQSAASSNTTSGLFGLGNAAIQSGALNGLGSYVGNLLGNNAYNSILSNNSGLNLSPSDLLSLG